MWTTLALVLFLYLTASTVLPTMPRRLRAFRRDQRRRCPSPPEASTNSTPVQHHPSTPNEAQHAAFLLHQLLPWELVPMVLDHAEYWPVQSRTVRHRAEYSEANSPARYLRLEVKTRTRAAQPVRKVVFRITSRDQGWASDLDSGSWTWFDALVWKTLPGRLRGREVVWGERLDVDSAVQGEGEEKSYQSVWERDLDDELANTLPSQVRRRQQGKQTPQREEVNQTELARAGDEGQGSSKEDEVDEVVVERIATNEIAKDEWQTHEVVWTRGSEQDDALSAMRDGSGIEVLVRAQFGGWVNHVHSVRVDVFVAAVR